MDFWRREEELMGGGEACELVGEEMATLVGNGILVGFAGQAALSLGLSAWVFFLTTHGNMDIKNPEGSIERVIERKRMEFVSSILMIGSDIQSTLGIAYMITAFAQIEILDTYHLRLAFDFVSFVGLSNMSALVCWRYCRAKLEPDTKHHPGRRSQRISARINYFEGRYRAAYIYLVLYLILIIVLCIRLDEWAPDTEPGRCYFTNLVTSKTASHPTADKVYVAVTGSWLIIGILASVFGGVNKRRWILIQSTLQFPLRLYMSIALRQANQGKFEGETNHENEWDFGQTTAVLLLGIAVAELVTKGKEYYDFEKHVAKNGISRSESERSIQDVEEANTNEYLLATRPSHEHTPEAGQPTRGPTAS
ncbi:unnamed protein product [Penicillium glandicola]